MSGIVSESWERHHDILRCPPCLAQLLLIHFGEYFAILAAVDWIQGVPA